MKATHDILAVLLAADDYPPLLEEETYREAKARLDASPDLRKEYEEARTFNQRHPALVDVGDMPDATRERIAKELERHSSLLSRGVHVDLSPWTVRAQFAWAAVLVLLLAGMAVLTSQLANRHAGQRRMAQYRNQPPEDAFRSFVGQVAQSPSLQKFDSNNRELVSWLETQTSSSLNVPEKFRDQEGIGCAYLNGPNGTVSLLCMNIEDQTVHLFMANASDMGLTSPHAPERMTIHSRDALQWNDEEHVYMLMTHYADEKLPEMFL